MMMLGTKDYQLKQWTGGRNRHGLRQL